MITQKLLFYAILCRKYRCLHSLEGEEAVVDIRFELDGDALAITRLTSGVHLYSIFNRRLLIQLSLPDMSVPSSHLYSLFCAKIVVL